MRGISLKIAENWLVVPLIVNYFFLTYQLLPGLFTGTNFLSYIELNGSACITLDNIIGHYNLFCYFKGLSLYNNIANIRRQILCLQGSPDGPEQYVLCDSFQFPLYLHFRLPWSFTSRFWFLKICCHNEFNILSTTFHGSDRFLCYRRSAFCFSPAGFLYYRRCVFEAPTNGWNVSVSFDSICHRFTFSQLFTTSKACRHWFSCFMFLSQKHNWHGLHMFCLFINIL